MTSKQRPLHVLVLDDDDKILRLLKVFLRQLGYKVTSAPNGREGIQIMLESQFDLIICDVQMPEVGGFTFADEALELWPWEKIIFCTGHMSKEMEQKAKSLGVKAILEKPFSFNTLETLIQEVCGSSDAQTEESNHISSDDLGFDLTQLRGFTHEVTIHQHFGKTISDYPRVIHNIIPCQAAGVFGMEGEYNQLSIHSNGPIAPTFIEKISADIRNHLEFFTGGHLNEMPLAVHKIIDSKAKPISESTHHSVMTPISGKRNAKGIIFIILEGERVNPRIQLNHLAICANHLSTLIELIDAFNAHAILNPLTGLYTKAYLDEQIRFCWNSAQNKKHPIGLLSLDLNDFHSINETYGYPAGDEVLKKVATLIQSQTLPTEIAVRCSGDEFCVLMPDASIERAQSLSKDLLREIQNLKPVTQSTTLNLSAAIGFAVTVDDHGITSSSQLIECAEHSRFAAKRKEGVKISSWTELKESGEASYNLHSVLVVDDDPQIVVLIKRLLNKSMYEVTGVNTVAEATTLLEKGNRYEVMLTDLALPHQDGTEMIRLGQEFDIEMVPLVISGNISKDSEQKLFQRGAFGVIKKPFIPDDLTNTVKKAVEHYTRSRRKNNETQTLHQKI